MQFQDCADIRWQVFVDCIEEQDVEADVIGFDFKKDCSANVTTDLFEIIVHYGKMSIQKDW